MANALAAPLKRVLGRELKAVRPGHLLIASPHGLASAFPAGAGDYSTSFKQEPLARLSAELQKILGKRYIRSAQQIELGASPTTLVLATGGPGDEIHRWSLYRNIVARLPGKIVFTCDPRLQGLLQRALPDSEVAPVGRLHRLWDAGNPAKLKAARLLPSLSLYRALDDNIWQKRENFDHITLVTDILSEIIQDRECFTGSPFTRPDAGKRAFWKGRLEAQCSGRVVGLSWRSTFSNPNRSIHYLSIEELRPVLDIGNCTFVLLQARASAQELAWLRSRYGKRIVAFDDLDMFDDFEGLSALLSCLDLVMTPATYISELCGALGVETLLFSNAQDVQSRRIPGTNTDLLFSTITHVTGNTCGDKASLAVSAAAALENALKAST